MKPKRGFTMVEVVIVILVGSILLSIAVKSMGGIRGTYAVRSARDTFLSLHARARAYAIERGEVTRLSVDPAGDSVWVHTASETIDIVDFQSMGVDIQASGSSVLRLCINPRGFGETSCNSFNNRVELDFVQQAERLRIAILPLGQIQY